MGENDRGPEGAWFDVTADSVGSASRDKSLARAAVDSGSAVSVAVTRKTDLLERGAVLSDTYEIGDLLGSGGMGQVFEARDLRLNRLVAVKVARPAVGGAALRQEGQALAAFRHPGLVTVHALGQHEGLDYLVMERLSGMTLAQHLDRRGAERPFTLDETLEILLLVADAVAVLHAAGLAHRDLKPENVMLAPRNRVVLLDLGITRLERFISDEKMMSGSPMFMAPETVLGSVKTGEAHLVDLYAFGVMAYEMLVGRSPFEAQTATQLLIDQVHLTPPSPTSLRPGIPPSLDRLVMELLAKHPDDRPSSIDVAIAALRSLRAALHNPATRPLDVLVVDDDPEMRRLLDLFVLQAVPGSTVRFADNGDAAIKAFHERAPDVMFLDLQMPVMNGMEVCMYLRGTRLADATTIVVVSSFADANQVLLEQLGVADVLAKKHRGPAELAGKVRSVLQRVEAARRSSQRRRDSSPEP